MNISKTALRISTITKTESGLLYYAPREIERAIKENRAIVLEEAGMLVAFALFHRHGHWVEISTVYVSSAYRGQGNLRKLISELERRIRGKYGGVFVFTTSPRLVEVVRSFGFKKANMFLLPILVFLSILRHRLFPLARTANSIKFFKTGAIFKMELYALSPV